MRKEIEVKARARDPKALLSNLEKLGCVMSEPVTQDDSIFVNFEGDFADSKAYKGATFLRIRKNKGKVIFTVKQPQANELDCIEHETEIEDADEMRSALLLMGYREAVQVVKTRRKTKYNGLEICVDEVKDLGWYIEVEKITDDESAEAVQEELFRFLETLGVRREDRETRGYDTLTYLSKKK